MNWNNFNVEKFTFKITKILTKNKTTNYYEFETEENVILKGKLKNHNLPDNKIINRTISVNGKKSFEFGKENVVFFNYELLRTEVSDEKEISCTIKSIIFSNEEDMFYILNTTEGIIKGIIPFHFNDIKDVEVLCKGEWVKSKQGIAFEFTQIELLENDIYFFLTKVVKGIGPALAKKLLKEIGEDALVEILENNPEKLLEVKGLKSQKLRKIKSHWDEYKHLTELSFLLKDYGIKTVTKIFNHFKNKSVEIIKENPYRLAEIKSIGFKIADKIKDTLGIKIDSLFRIEAGILYCLEKDMDDNGNSYISKTDLFEISSMELNIENDFTLNRELFETALNELENNRFSSENRLRKKSIIYLDKEKEIIAKTDYHEMEIYILDVLKSKLSLPKKQIVSNVNEYIISLEKDMNMKFSDEQKEAIIIANTGLMVFSLSGYAGTGKSTISKAIINLLTKRYSKDKVVCTALSGMAANRIKKTTGFPAMTIHSLLKFKKNEWVHNKDNPLPYDIVLVDESSMINTQMFYRLVDAIGKDTVVMFVGDPAQLPPIGAGNVFSDIIKNKLVPGGSLTKIYRQSEDAVITYFASFIRKGQLPPNLEKKYDDFSFETRDLSWGVKNLPDKEQKEAKERNNLIILNDVKNVIKEKSKEIQAKYQSSDIKEYINFLQIIAPMKMGILGTDYLNKISQQIINPRDENKEYKKLELYGINEIRVRDKILHKRNANMTCQKPQDYKKEPFNIKNSFEERVYNGQLGVVINIDDELLEVHVYYPNEDYVVNYQFKEAKDYLDLSYALTIHKTQGSEFSNVIMPIVSSHFVMLNNQLLYTAITRAKDNIKVFGHSFAFKKATTTMSSEQRNTIINYVINNTKLYQF